MIKKKFEEIVKFVEDKGYRCLTKKENYQNTGTKLDLVCKEGHHFKMSQSGIQQGYGCKQCNWKNHFDKLRLKRIKYMKERIAKLKPEWIWENPEEYTNAFSKLKLICDKGHYIEMVFFNLENHGCRECHFNSVRNDLDYFKKKTKEIKPGWTFLGLNSGEIFSNKRNQKFNFICDNSHKIKKTWENFLASGCPKCYGEFLSLYNIGPKHPQWRGGISCEPYCQVWSDKEFRQYIKERDGCRCLNPYCSSKNPDKLVGHHIDYDKKNCHPSNIITLCSSCNFRANKDRDWHKSWYQALMYNRYGYEYEYNLGGSL